VNEDDGHTELALAQRYLRGTSVPQDRDMAAHLLWVAVGDGNPQAELELADLYLRTDGVPAKNCAQARILLSASSDSGNLEAGEKLARLRDYGCR
jgi:TPR repeat protein